jgi:exosome complex component RRP41
MLDRRRFTLATCTGTPHSQSSIRPIFSKSHSNQPSSRPANSLRSPLLVKTGAVKGSAGSCYLEHGKTKIICSTLGPRQSTGANCIGEGAIRCTCRYASYLVGNASEQSSNNNSQSIQRLESQLERAVEAALSSTVLLDRIPNSQIEIFICIIDDEAAGLSSSECEHLVPDAINAAVVAVVAAAIEVQDVISSFQVAINPVMLMDPSAGELACSGYCTICYSAAHNEVIQVKVHANESQQELVKEAVQCAIDGAVAVREVMVKALERGVHK